MSSLRTVGRSAATIVKDRVSFIFADGRQCHQIMPALTHLNATLTGHPTSVDSKQLTTCLNPLESTLTKKMGGGGVMVNQIFE